MARRDSPRGDLMRASLGDHIVLAAQHVGEPTRAGRVVEVRGEGGGPPYVVEWSDGHTGVIFPGPGTVLSVSTPGEEPEVPEVDTQPAAVPHAREWKVQVTIFETKDDTDARAVLVADAPQRLVASGQSHRAPHDQAVPAIGDEVAVARALRHLADLLMAEAESEIAVRTGEDAQVRRT